VRFEGVEYEQSYKGVWHGEIAYNYLIEQRNAKPVVQQGSPSIMIESTEGKG